MMYRSLRPLLATTVAGLILAVPLLGPGAPAAAQGVDDPDLEQTLDDLRVVDGEKVLDSGHVDMGPKFDGDTWRLLVHDDAALADASATSVWRYPENTVFRVLDESKVTLPEDPAYSFTGAEPGNPVWVVPQTQNPDVVWLGWNTQDPEVMRSIDRGVTISLTGVEGPGVATVYLQSGSFGEPQVLWDSRKAEEQPLWVDVNTHTHANWVFTKPGVYLVRLRVEADLVDGRHVSDTQVVRFAVGTKTSTDQALTATWDGAEDSGTTTDEANTPAAPEVESAGDPLVPLLVGAIVLVAVALIAGFGIAFIRGNRARRQVLAARTSAGEGTP